MPPDGDTIQPNNDALMIQQLGFLLTDLQFNFVNATPLQRAQIRPALEEALAKYENYRRKLLEDSVLTTQQDLDEIRQIKNEIDNAAITQTLLTGIARLIAFVALRGGV